MAGLYKLLPTRERRYATDPFTDSAKCFNCPVRLARLALLAEEHGDVASIPAGVRLGLFCDSGTTDDYFGNKVCGDTRSESTTPATATPDTNADVLNLENKAE